MTLIKSTRLDDASTTERMMIFIGRSMFTLVAARRRCVLDNSWICCYYPVSRRALASSGIKTFFDEHLVQVFDF